MCVKYSAFSHHDTFKYAFCIYGSVFRINLNDKKCLTEWPTDPLKWQHGAFKRNGKKKNEEEWRSKEIVKLLK